MGTATMSSAESIGARLLAEIKAEQGTLEDVSMNSGASWVSKVLRHLERKPPSRPPLPYR